MEDDTDWDVDFRSQLENFAFGSQLLAITPRRHYGNQPVAGDERRALVENDPAVTPLIHRTNFIVVPDMTHYEHSQDSLRKSRGIYVHTLMLFRTAVPKKALFYLSTNPHAKPIDWGLHEMCDHEDRDFKCMSVPPQIVDTCRAVSSLSKDSNIAGVGDRLRSKGTAFSIVHSIVRNSTPHILLKATWTRLKINGLGRYRI